ncbi:hypothetical protein C0Q70_08666 [Pomacea canaliculata]|uniref:Uncharacterized protein n=1 Tax=Pomacea canaliculata TaxID=400727 RepID=A0A2T7P7L0_POMCA|nr:hypothetical protein C0Q70_08666 [Pomacea canaliculata]
MPLSLLCHFCSVPLKLRKGDCKQSDYSPVPHVEAGPRRVYGTSVQTCLVPVVPVAPVAVVRGSPCRRYAGTRHSRV